MNSHRETWGLKLSAFAGCGWLCMVPDSVLVSLTTCNRPSLELSETLRFFFETSEGLQRDSTLERWANEETAEFISKSPDLKTPWNGCFPRCQRRIKDSQRFCASFQTLLLSFCQVLYFSVWSGCMPKFLTSFFHVWVGTAISECILVKQPWSNPLTLSICLSLR